VALDKTHRLTRESALMAAMTINPVVTRKSVPTRREDRPERGDGFVATAGMEGKSDISARIWMAPLFRKQRSHAVVFGLL